MLQSDQVKMSEAASAFGTKLTFDTPNGGTSRMMLRTAKIPAPIFGDGNEMSRDHYTSRVR